MTTITTTDEAIRALMQRLAVENLQVLALVKMGYSAREIDKIMQTGDRCPRSSSLPLRPIGAVRPA
jgi:hypothetical protein